MESGRLGDDDDDDDDGGYTVLISSTDICKSVFVGTAGRLSIHIVSSMMLFCVDRYKEQRLMMVVCCC